MKYVYMIILVICVLSCGNNKSTNPDLMPPIIISVNPTSFYTGDRIIINGKNFGSKRDTNKVIFNYVDGIKYLLWNDICIQLIIPDNAHDGNLYVSINGIKSNEIYLNIDNLAPYSHVRINGQLWMVRNLDVDHYRNGDPIPEVEDIKAWPNLTTGAWCYYENDSTNGHIYGKLYNWYAVNDPRGLAPDGWHIPNYYEWNSLITFVGKHGGADKLKQYPSSLWHTNEYATNSTGFTALPGGHFIDYGTYTGEDIHFGVFQGIGLSCYFWSSSIMGSIKDNNVLLITLYYDSGVVDFEQDYINHNCSMNNGCSIRCIKN